MSDVPSLPVFRSFAIILCLCFTAAPRASAAEPWKTMDYGPFMSATLAAPYPKPENITNKGIIIPLKPDRSVNVVFDTDLLCYGAGWSGGFVDWNNVAFNGEHERHLSLVGQPLFQNRTQPGWADAKGKFDDPRSIPFGPLPREQWMWKGIYLHDHQVVLSYRVGDCDVLELPGLIEQDGFQIITRTIQLRSSAHDLILQVCESAGGQARLKSYAGLKIASLRTRPTSTQPAENEPETIAVGLIGSTKGCDWELNETSAIRLRVAASPKPRTIKLMIWGGTERRAEAFAKLIRSEKSPRNLDDLTRGGPPRWKQKLTTQGQLGNNDGPYAIDLITRPQENPWRSRMRFGGFDFFKDGRRAAICTWDGDVWLVDGIDETLSKLTWQRIATGLFQPLGLKIVDEQIYVLGRDQITRLHDLNGDGESDFYENFNNDHQVTEHFHEFAMDLQVGPDGDFYYMKGGRHAKEAVVPQHGTMLHVSKDGKKTEIVCGGFRAPNGLAISPDGEFITTDQEGHWTPQNRIDWLKPGKFYGYMWGYHTGPRPTTYEPPVCWVPKWLDHSPSAPVWITSDKWGLPKGGLVTLSYGTSRIYSALYEEVNGVRQGGEVVLPVMFDTGLMRGRFHPFDGQLYTCGMFGSWGSDKTGEGEFGRVRYTGHALHLPIGLHAIQYGMVVTFSDPLDAGTAVDPNNYLIERWGYPWTERYGSDDYRLSDGQKGRDRLVATGVKLSTDHRSIFLQIPDMKPCMQMQIKYNLRAADGAAMSQTIANTIHVLGKPELPDISFEGGLTPPPPAPKEQTQSQDLEPGLILRFVQAPHTRDIESQESLDIRRSRLLALSIPKYDFPSPFMDAGRFAAILDGYIQTELADTYTFKAEGRGRFALYINGQEVSAPSDLPAEGRSVDLPAGLSRIEARLLADNRNGDARLRVYWESKDIPREPIPPTVLFHDSKSSKLEPFDRLHEGRKLLATRHCLKCHTPDQPDLMKNGMLELSMDAPSLEGIGSRLNSDWIAHWISDPRKMRPDARMPHLFHDADNKQKAVDIAAYLSTLVVASPNTPPATVDITKGAACYEAFGCMGCHTLGNEKETDQYDRMSLGYVRVKFKPDALRQFLLMPERHNPWSRMPNFHLNEPQAADVAAYLVSTPQETLDPFEFLKEPDADRGKALLCESGCLNCHQLPLTNQYKSPTLAQLKTSDWSRACLAKAPSAERAPDFGFGEPQRNALQSLARTDQDCLRRRDLNDLAQRQIKELRCSACHSLDGQADTCSQLMPQTQPEEETEEGSSIKRLADLLGVKQVNDFQGRPALTWAGEKFHVEWMSQFIAGAIDRKPRPGLLARMPSFPAYAEALAHGLARQHGVTEQRETEPAIDREMAAVGEPLIGVNNDVGFGCTTCHSVGKQPPVVGSTLQAINFSMVHRRLRKEYYWHWISNPQRVEPGSMMPSFVEADWRSPFTAFYEGDARKQFDAIWQYLRTVEDTPSSRPAQE